MRHEQALETLEIIVAFCGLNVQDAMNTEAGVASCRFCTTPAVTVVVVVAVGIITEWTTSPVVTVVLVVTVLCL